MRAVAQAADPGYPSVLAHLASFHGQLTYRAHRVEAPEDGVAGTLRVEPGAWALDETQNCCHLHASDRGSWLRSNDLTLSFDDPLRVDTLVNSWAVLLGIANATHLQRDRNGTSWTSSSGLRIYLDATGTQVLGIADTRGGIAFSYSDWTDDSGLSLPRSIVRLRAGTPDASFIVDDYQAQWSVPSVPAFAAAPDVRAQPAEQVAQQQAPANVSWGVGLWNIMAAFALCAVLIALWMRRDALMERVGAKLAHDPNAWQPAATNLSVSAEGMLSFEGCSYRVGPVFFNRAVVVQTSPLFIRVSAPGESRVLVMARKFRAPAALRRRAPAGFTLVESLTACAVFAVVIVAAVFPALVVLAHADRIAAHHEVALRIAANALTDEEAALAYAPPDSSIVDDAKSVAVDGMTLSERLAPSGTAGLHTLTIDVSDSTGKSLARLVTIVGPPVPPPAASSSPPPGGP